MKYKLEYKGMGESGFFDFYRSEDVMAIVKAARDLINIDNEVHSISDEEERSTIVEKIGRYLVARDRLSLLIKPIEEEEE